VAYKLVTVGVVLNDTLFRLKYLVVSKKVLNSDKVVSQRSASIPNAVEDNSCLVCADQAYMFIGKKIV
jgi:hypothetical protein